MKRNILRISASLLCACALSLGLVSAAGSVSNNGTVSQDFTINGKKVDTEKVQATFKTDFSGIVIEKEVVNKIAEINAAPEKVAEVLAEIKVEDPSIDTSALQLLTAVQDLSIIDKETGEVMKDARNVTITWEVPNLSTNVGEVRVLHYSTVRNVWELITPSDVDYANKAVTATFPDLSPVAVVYVPASETGKGTATKPADDDAVKETAASKTDNSGLMIAGILLLAGAGCMVFKAKKA